jgi:internalin A
MAERQETAAERIRRAAESGDKELKFAGWGSSSILAAFDAIDQFALDFSTLTTLDLSDNRLERVPEGIIRLSNLTTLNLSNNRIREVPGVIAHLSNLTALDLSSNQIIEVTEDITRLSKLTTLNLSSNKLREVHEVITRLFKLTSLNLSHNQLREVPERIALLASLTTLDLSHNELIEVPDHIALLSTLTMLDLRDNKLKEVCEGIALLTSLTTLDLSHNRINEVHRGIARLSNLTMLDLSYNQLKEVPEGIALLHNLIDLELGGNKLKEVPEGIARLSNLKKFELRNNPLLRIPLEIIAHPEDAPAILRYIAATRRAEAKRPLAEAKMLVVGQGGVGKTSLVKMLLFSKCGPNELKTEGIDIQRWPLQAGGEPVQLNVWDFGGQEILHSTHQFFLTRRSLYLLVLDARQGEREGRIEYWLKIIESFGGDSPVIVVVNRSDEHRLELNQRGLMEKYPKRIRAFVETSCKAPFRQPSGAMSDGIKELGEEIAAAVGALDHVRDLLPASWFSIKEQLEAMKKKENYFPRSRYEEMCVDQGVDDAGDQKVLIGLLHDLGVVIHYQGDRRLQDTNILNPEWVTQGIYRILNANALFQSKGVLSVDQLGSILDVHVYPPDKYDFLLGMMRKFELCFPFDGDDDHYLVPELLPKEEPDLLAERAEVLGFAYHYPVLPGAVISRFIVRMHLWISKRTSWRTGVVLEIEGNKAVVKADLEEARVVIAVYGPEASRRRVLAVIRSSFDHIHATIPGLNPEEKVPVPGQVCKPVDYQHLLRLERKGIEAFIPEGAEDEVSVRRLLDGIESPEQRSQREERRMDTLRPLPPSEAPVSASPPSPTRNNPWVAGSFYVFAFVMIAASVAAVTMVVSALAVPFVLIAAILALAAISAAQLRNDERLKEKGFVDLMGMALKRLVLLRSEERKPAAGGLPEAGGEPDPPKLGGTRRRPPKPPGPRPERR